MKIIFRQSWTKILTIVPLFLLIFASKTLAHHAMAGQTPDNFWNGFLSGFIGLFSFFFFNLPLHLGDSSFFPIEM